MECLVKRMQIAVWLTAAQAVTVDRVVPGAAVLWGGQAVDVAVAEVEGLVQTVAQIVDQGILCVAVRRAVAVGQRVLVEIVSGRY